jgi:dolichyl-phosphate-mannose--protein O-mannosyl transferase
MFPWCVLFFIIVPLFVYCLFYVFFLPGPTGIRDIWRHQLQMFNYHSKLEATHPFSSPWWQWPLMIRPIWLYQGKGLPPGQISSIVSLGNPAIWWGGTLVLLFSLILPLFRKEKALPFILIGFLAQYLPWVLVPRLTFIYHFYNSVPFYILLIVLFYRKIRENYPRYKPFLFGYLALAAFLFFLFYPVLSGEIVSKNYVATYLRWLPSWTFFIN